MKKTITSRLEALLAKIAGKEEDPSTITPGVPINLSEQLMLDIADRIDGIADNSLPEVSADDNGDVLTVVEVAWAKAAPSGGSDLFIVEVTWDDNANGYSPNQTYADAVAAIAAGKVVVIVNDGSYGADIAHMNMSGDAIAWVQIEVALSGGSGQDLYIHDFRWNVSGITESNYYVTINAE